jgi:hypothetical protein
MARARLHSGRLGWAGTACAGAAVALAFALFAACEPGEPALEQRMEARALVAELRAALHASAEAEKRAVLSETEEESAAAVAEAEAEARAVGERAAVLAAHLTALQYEPERQLLHTFEERFAELQRVDADLLPLARGHTNERAWQLALGAGRQAADELAARSAEAARAVPRRNRASAEAASTAAFLAVREIQVLEAPHIREPDDARMTALEARMAAAAQRARDSLAKLRALSAPASRPALDAASEALESFLRNHADVVRLSRENTDVRSTALSLGEKQRLTAACDDALSALQEALEHRATAATR